MFAVHAFDDDFELVYQEQWLFTLLRQFVGSLL